MTVYAGGTRDRLIHDSLFYEVQAGLAALGWFAQNPTGFVNPINMIPEQTEWDEEIPLNSITVAPGGIMDEEWEMGTFGMKNTHIFFIDVYGENESLSSQLVGDIRDIVRGKLPNIGYSQPTLNVYDYTQATPSFIFFCDVENVTSVRVTTFSHRWQRYLYELRLEVIDYYGSEADQYYADGNLAGPGTDTGGD
jgi:hypothetical protein